MLRSGGSGCYGHAPKGFPKGFEEPGGLGAASRALYPRGAMVESATNDLLERESELEALRATIEAAAEGGGRVVVIEGAAGIGKTSLLRAARTHAADCGLRVLAARGGELERTFPFGVVRQLFEPVVAHASANELEWAFQGHAALAGPLLGAGGSAQSDDRGGEHAFAVVHGLYWLAANLSERNPLLLSVDDLQWSDVDSLRWLAYLAHRIEGLSVLVAAAVRRLEAAADPALAELVADPSALSVRPAPLTSAAVAEIVSERLSTGVVERVAAVCHETTGGNPLLLRELLTALVGAQLASDPDEVAVEVGRLAPQVVARRMRLELAKLGPEATSLAQAVAVLGDDVELAHAAALAGLEEAPAREAVARLARAELLGRDRLLSFAHPLLRGAVYEAIPAPERGLAHARAAGVLEAAGASIERVSAQLVAAPPAGSAQTAATLREAARRSLAHGAAVTAVSQLRRALAEPPPAAERAGVLLELAAAEAFVGAPETAARLREAIGLLDEGPTRVHARLELARALFWTGDGNEAVAEIEAGVAEAADLSVRRALQAEYYATALRLPTLHAQAHASLAALDVPDDDWGSRMLLSLKAYSLALAGEERERAVELAEQGIARGMTWEAVTWAFWGGVYTLVWADRFDPALAFVDGVLAEARRRGAPVSFSGTSMVRASIGFYVGRLVEAEADARASLDALPHRRVMFAAYCVAWLAQTLVERGRLDEAADLLAEAGADGPLAESYADVSLLRARAALRLAQGSPEAAAADALACGRIYESVGIRNPAATHWRSDAALALLVAGRNEEARRLAAAELELARRWGAPRAAGHALRVAGLVEGGDAGLASLRDSVLLLEQSPALLERARSLVELGSALRRSLKRIEARDRLRAGLDLAQRCGALALAERAREELVAAGAKPRATAVSGAAALTPSERRVAGMASEGMTNRQIAQALFVTPRTVEMHLSNAFRKLRIGSRTQLPEALAS